MDKADGVVVKRVQSVLGCDMFYDRVELGGRSGDGLSERYCKIAAALAYGDKLRNGYRILVSDGARAKEITVDFMEEHNG